MSGNYINTIHIVKGKFNSKENACEVNKNRLWARAIKAQYSTEST